MNRSEGSAMSRNDGAQGRAKVQPLVDVIRNQPRPHGPATSQDGLLFRPAERPAGRVVRAVDDHGSHARLNCIQEPLEIERPPARTELQRHRDQLGAQDLRYLAKVRPYRRDGNHCAAGVDDRLQRDHQPRDRRAGNRDAIGRDRSVPVRKIGCNVLPQPGQAKIRRIEGVALRESGRAGGANGLRCRQLGFAKPKSQNVIRRPWRRWRLPESAGSATRKSADDPAGMT